MDSVKTELRQAELAQRQIEFDLNLATESFENPDQLLLTPSKLVNSQPGLRRLREGLANASIASSELLGRYTEKHPLVIASLQAVSQIREQLRHELGLSVQALTKGSGERRGADSQVKATATNSRKSLGKARCHSG